MARMARAVAPGIPHHIIHRGNRCQATFFCEEDYCAYLEIMAQWWCGRCSVEIWAYCLMPNHVYLIGVPESEEALRLAIGEAHRRYTRRINFREGWCGHLWQGRFASFGMDERYPLAAVRHVELNHVRAGLAASPEAYLWSGAAAHMEGRDDVMVRVSPLLEMVGDWGESLSQEVAQEDVRLLRSHKRGWPRKFIVWVAKRQEDLTGTTVPMPYMFSS